MGRNCNRGCISLDIGYIFHTHRTEMKNENTEDGNTSLSDISGRWLQAKFERLTSGLTIGTWKREVLEGLSTMSALNCQVSTPGFRQSVSER